MHIGILMILGNRFYIISSWGQTRKVEGEDKGHGSSHGDFDESTIPLKKWLEWENERKRLGAVVTSPTADIADMSNSFSRIPSMKR